MLRSWWNSLKTVRSVLGRCRSVCSLLIRLQSSIVAIEWRHSEFSSDHSHLRRNHLLRARSFRICHVSQLPLNEEMNNIIVDQNIVQYRATIVAMQHGERTRGRTAHLQDLTLLLQRWVCHQKSNGMHLGSLFFDWSAQNLVIGHCLTVCMSTQNILPTSVHNFGSDSVQGRTRTVASYNPTHCWDN